MRGASPPLPQKDLYSNRLLLAVLLMAAEVAGGAEVLRKPPCALQHAGMCMQADNKAAS